MSFKTLLLILTTMMMMNCKGQTSAPLVRPATQAGRFYESDPQVLSHEVDSLLAQHTKPAVSGDSTAAYENVAALIVPHAGYYFSGNVAASAYAKLNPEKKYKRIFLLGPSHHEWLDGASVNTEADYYATPLGEVKVDRETANLLTTANLPNDTSSVFTYQPKAHDREHCLEVQLPFLQKLFTSHLSPLTSHLSPPTSHLSPLTSHLNSVPPIVPIIISTNDFAKLKQIADALKPYFTDENLFIISSDFSHYPSYGDACAVDAKTGKAVESGDVSQFIAAIETNARSNIRNLATSACGEFPIITLMLMLDKQYQVKHIMYQNSGDIDSHAPSRVVGYHSFAVVRSPLPSSDKGGTESESFLTDEEKKILKKIAYESIKDSLDGKPISHLSSLTSHLSSLTSHLSSMCGAFVSLHKHGRLRGCIGHFGEDIPLHEIVARMARAAAFEDPRFSPLRRQELDDVDIEISVLTPMRRIQSLDEFQLHRHGIYIRKGYRSGTFLPQVADEVNWTKEEFVAHCSQDKAGLGWDGWRDAELYVYEAIVF